MKRDSHPSLAGCSLAAESRGFQTSCAVRKGPSSRVWENGSHTKAALSLPGGAFRQPYHAREQGALRSGELHRGRDAGEQEGKAYDVEALRFSCRLSLERKMKCLHHSMVAFKI